MVSEVRTMAACGAMALIANSPAAFAAPYNVRGLGLAASVYGLLVPSKMASLETWTSRAPTSCEALSWVNDL